MSTFKPDAGIPILTEIISAPPLSETELDYPAQSLAATGPEAATDPFPRPSTASRQPATAISSDVRAMLDAQQWDQLEREVRERVLQQVLVRIDSMLEQRVRDSLADVLQTAVEGLASELRSGLQQTVKDVISRAVTQEINATRFSKF